MKTQRNQWSRRDFLQTSLKASGVLASAPMVNLLGWSSAFGAGPKHGGELIVAQVGDPGNLDPHKNAAVIGWNILHHVCEKLLNYDSIGNIIPELATSWEISNDGKTYTFQLQKGVKFHNGREFVASDVQYSYERMKSEGSLVAKYFEKVASVDVLHDHAVKFTLSEVYAPFLNFVARIGSHIVPEEEVKAQGGKIGDFQKPVGTGPFKFVEYKADTHVILERFSAYRIKDQPYLDRLRFIPIKDDRSRLTALQVGDVDLIANVPYKDAARLSNSPQHKIAEATGSSWYQIYFNTQNVPVKLRQALAHGIRKQDVVDTGLYGHGTVAEGPYASTNPWFVDPGNFRKFDPEMATKLYKEAGRTSVELKTNSQYEIMQQTAIISQANMQEIGFEIKIVQMDWPSMLQDFLKKNYAAMTFGIPLKNDPDEYYGAFLKKDGWLNYENEAVWRLIELGTQEVDMAKRKAIYGEIQKHVNHDAPWISIAHLNGMQGMKKTVMGYEPWVFGYLRFHNVWKEA
jgi:peptide/nickel transport system substrate-binding protein